MAGTTKYRSRLKCLRRIQNQCKRVDQAKQRKKTNWKTNDDALSIKNYKYSLQLQEMCSDCTHLCNNQHLNQSLYLCLALSLHVVTTRAFFLFPFSILAFGSCTLHTLDTICSFVAALRFFFSFWFVCFITFLWAFN